MLLHLFILTVIINGLSGKAILSRKISDCIINDDGILSYKGKHSFTKFHHECLPWSDLQTMFTDVINEPNFHDDTSIKAAKNYCRNPNMDPNGPWCFFDNEGNPDVELCDVCQSLQSKPTPPVQTESRDEVTTDKPNNRLFENIQKEIRRFGVYLREKSNEIIQQIKQYIRKLQSRISNHYDSST